MLWSWPSDPKQSKVIRCPELAAEVQRRLSKKHSPEQISARLRADFPDDDRMRISHEAIYQSIYVHSRGGLRRELVPKHFEVQVRAVLDNSACRANHLRGHVDGPRSTCTAV